MVVTRGTLNRVEAEIFRSSAPFVCATASCYAFPSSLISTSSTTFVIVAIARSDIVSDDGTVKVMRPSPSRSNLTPCRVALSFAICSSGERGFYLLLFSLIFPAPIIGNNNAIGKLFVGANSRRIITVNVLSDLFCFCSSHDSSSNFSLPVPAGFEPAFPELPEPSIRRFNLLAYDLPYAGCRRFHAEVWSTQRFRQNATRQDKESG
jgi:hypothetical protein